MPMTRTPAVTAVVVAGVSGGSDAILTPRPARPGLAGATTARPHRASRPSGTTTRPAPADRGRR